MKHSLLTVIVLLAVGVAACTKTATSPSQSATTTVATTTSTTSTTTTTSVPGPTSFTLSGRVTDVTTSALLRFADIEIIEGANVGRRFQADTNGVYSMSNLNPGTFTMRVWAFGYFTNDVRVTITNADARLDVALTPAPPTTSTTTTTVPPTKADFSATPVPCTITNPGAVVDCTVDAYPSTGTIVMYEWKYKGRTVTNNPRINLQLACSDLGREIDDTVFVTLTVTDDQGGTNAITKGVVIVKVNGACP